MSKILHLTLKKKWFDMIASGEKKEEYREMTCLTWAIKSHDVSLESMNKFIDMMNGLQQ